MLQMQAEPGNIYSCFRKWYEAKAWKAVTLCEELIEEQDKHAGKVFAWMTEAQLQDHDKNEYVGTQIAKKDEYKSIWATRMSSRGARNQGGDAGEGLALGARSRNIKKEAHQNHQGRGRA